MGDFIVEPQAPAKEAEQASDLVHLGLLVENEATAAVAEAKGIPDLLLPFIRDQVKVVEEDGEFKVFVVDKAAG